MGGFECSTHCIRSGRRLDIVASSQHERFAFQDYQRLQAVGMTTARDGFRWHLIETSPGQYDFSSVLRVIRAARENGVQVVWDLMHYGWPDGLDILSPEFVIRFAGCRARGSRSTPDRKPCRADRLPDQRNLVFSWAAGEVAYFYPFLNERGEEVKEQMIRASIAAMVAIWQVAPNARFVHCDPMIHMAANARKPQQKSAAERQRRSQFESWDMIAGRRKAHLGGNPKYLDIIGANYYIHNQWIHAGGPNTLSPPSHPQHRPPGKFCRKFTRVISARFSSPKPASKPKNAHPGCVISRARRILPCETACH